MLAANIDAACEAASLREDEVMVSWLPLYHDMGLVRFLAIPMTTGVELVQAAPQDFMAHPQLDGMDLRVGRRQQLARTLPGCSQPVCVGHLISTFQQPCAEWS